MRDRNWQLVLGDNLYNPIRRAAQREGIFRARRLQAKRKHSGNAVGLIGNREHGSLDGTRNAVVHRLRLVLIVDSVADSLCGSGGKYGIELLDLGIQAADNA